MVHADAPALCSKAKDTRKKQVFSGMGRKKIYRNESAF